MIDHATELEGKSRRRRSIGICGLLAIAFTFAAILANSFFAAAERRAAEAWRIHTLDVLLASGHLESAANEALRGQRGYLITGNREFLEPFANGRHDSLRLVRALRNATGDNPVQQRNVEAVAQRLDTYLATLDRLVTLQERGETAQAIAAVRDRDGRREIIDFLAALGRFEAEERRLLDLRSAASAAAERRTEAFDYFLAAAGALILALLASALMSASGAYRSALEMAGELHRLATVDPLTGLPNRRQLMAQMEIEVTRALRSGRPLALALLDVDRFKAVNDGHGHPAGDAVLQAVADELRQVGRGGDVLGRFGGEEFAVLMPETGIEQARIAGERLRAAIAARTILFPDGSVGRVTVSAGVALLTGTENCDHLISRADAALYAAKNGGRNMVRLAA